MSQAADFFTFLSQKVVCLFSFVYALFDLFELFVTLGHIFICPMKSELQDIRHKTNFILSRRVKTETTLAIYSYLPTYYGLFVGFKRFTNLGIL